MCSSDSNNPHNMEAKEDSVPESIVLAVSLALTDPAMAAELADWWADSVSHGVKESLGVKRKINC